MGIPEMQTFGNCMSSCMQQQGIAGSAGSFGGPRGGKGGGGLSACATEQGCTLNEVAIQTAKQLCKQQTQSQSQPFDPMQHQQHCICLRNAFK